MKGIHPAIKQNLSFFFWFLSFIFFSSLLALLALGQFPRVNFNYAHSKRNEIKSGACKVFDRRQRSENCCGIIESVAADALLLLLLAPLKARLKLGSFALAFGCIIKNTLTFNGTSCYKYSVIFPFCCSPFQVFFSAFVFVFVCSLLIVSRLKVILKFRRHIWPLGKPLKCPESERASESYLSAAVFHPAACSSGPLHTLRRSQIPSANAVHT